MSNAALEGYFHIFTLGYPLKHGYDSWQILSHSCIWMNAGRMHPTKTDCGTICFGSSNAHFTAWIWVMNTIDDANAFLFTIWFDKLGGIHGEELWAYNDEPFTAKYEMHVRTTWQFHEGWWPHILEGYVSTVGKFMTNWQSWWVLAWCTQLIRG